MCIRDRASGEKRHRGRLRHTYCARGDGADRVDIRADEYTCLLYTSDAADERSSVDLGGRRIIKQKQKATYAIERETVTDTTSKTRTT